MLIYWTVQMANVKITIFFSLTSSKKGKYYESVWITWRYTNFLFLCRHGYNRKTHTFEECFRLHLWKQTQRHSIRNHEVANYQPECFQSIPHTRVTCRIYQVQFLYIPIKEELRGKQFSCYNLQGHSFMTPVCLYIYTDDLWCVGYQNSSLEVRFH